MIILAANLNCSQKNDESKKWQTQEFVDDGRTRTAARGIGRAENSPRLWHADLHLARWESSGGKTLNPPECAKPRRMTWWN
jgi:hypothetical protein